MQARQEEHAKAEADEAQRKEDALRKREEEATARRSIPYSTPFIANVSTSTLGPVG